jgi:Mycothiol maleylpyruvate isomerase N-terminal domain
VDAIDVLTYGQRTVMATVRRYGPGDWDQIALGVWTAKDLLGHLGAFEARFADVLATFVGAPVETDLMTVDPAAFNDAQAAIRKDWPSERITDEFLSAHERVMTHARALPPDRWREVGTIPWYGPQYSLDDLVVYTMYGHKREHDPQLSAVLETRGS